MKIPPLANTALLLFLLAPSVLFAQGSLTPPGAPAPTMKTLQQVEPRTPISSLPFSVATSGSYYLTTNLTGQAGTNGITISADNVTIDLQGFALSGVSNSLDGVAVITVLTNHHNVAIENGIVCNWAGNGVNVSIANNSRLERLRIFRNGGYGLYVGAESMVGSCSVQSNGNSGIIVGAGSVVSGCTSSGNANAGIENYRFNNDVTLALIKGCSIHDNLGSGIQGSATVIENNCAGNIGAGIFLNGSGAFVANNYFRQNGTAVQTSVSSSTNVIIRNVAIANTNGYVIGGSGNIVGPIINAAAFSTNSNPNANFSF